MPRWVNVRNRTRGGLQVLRARWCESALCRMRGLTFRRRLPEGSGLLLVGPSDSVSRASIHMVGVFFPLGVVWINSRLEVVEARLAQPWRMYIPSSPARYVLEGAPSMLELVSSGEELEFADEDHD